MSAAMERITSAGAVFQTDHRARTSLRYHSHGVPFATIVLSGSYSEVGDGSPRRCDAGAIVVHSGNEQHADYFRRDSHCLNVELPSCELAGHPVQNSTAMSPLPKAIAELMRAFYVQEKRIDEEALERAVRDVQQALRQQAEPLASPVPQWLQAAIASFAWSDGEPLGRAASMAGVHQVHFSRAFRRYMHMTPNAYRRQMRMRAASKLLLDSTSSLARIAQQCGFADQSHFTRTFVESVGLTPAAYRRVFTS
jgi:AraC family transcriptional regulator